MFFPVAGRRPQEDRNGGERRVCCDTPKVAIAATELASNAGESAAPDSVFVLRCQDATGV